MKDQGTCGSSVAFATVAIVESCYKRTTKVLTSLSEQQLLDCAYSFQGASGCEPTPLFSYLEWMATVGRTKLVSASDYPYQGEGPFPCEKNKPVVNARALIKDVWFTNTGDENQLRKLVNQNSDAITALCFTPSTMDAFRNYTGGIFTGCAADAGKEPADCQAVTVVDYGKEKGVDYWLIRNSWGSSWGEEGYLRLKMGVGMCEVAKSIGVVECAKYNGGPVLVGACEAGEEECAETEGEEEEGDEEEGEEEEGDEEEEVEGDQEEENNY